HCSVEPARNPMLARAFQRNLNGYSPREHYLQPFRGSPAKELFDICLYHDLRVYLPQLLHKEDRASMAVSLESRLPLLDHRIVELMARIPGQRKVPGMVPKGMLRAAARNVLPPEVANRKDKMPFAVPMNEWLTQDLRRFAYEILTSEATLDRGIFDPDVIRSNQLGVEQMLGMLNVELWARVFVDGDTTLPIDTASAGAFAA
ncbi:MAG TPA: asparagine synthase C-terminal domain-containing protein, partial [Steroidobacteraceae bacterium]